MPAPRHPRSDDERRVGRGRSAGHESHLGPCRGWIGWLTFALVTTGGCWPRDLRQASQATALLDGTKVVVEQAEERDESYTIIPHMWSMGGGNASWHTKLTVEGTTIELPLPPEVNPKIVTVEADGDRLWVVRETEAGFAFLTLDGFRSATSGASDWQEAAASEFPRRLAVQNVFSDAGQMQNPQGVIFERPPSLFRTSSTARLWSYLEDPGFEAMRTYQPYAGYAAWVGPRQPEERFLEEFYERHLRGDPRLQLRDESSDSGGVRVDSEHLQRALALPEGDPGLGEPVPGWGRLVDIALEHAVQDGNAGAVKKLLRRGANPNINAGYPPEPLLLSAALQGGPVVKALLQAGASPDVESPEGTPMARAAFYGVTSSVEELLAAGADPQKASARFPSALEAARSGRYVHCLRVLEAAAKSKP